MSIHDIDVVRRYFARCAEHDCDIVEMYTEDAEFFDCAGPETFTGRRAIAEHVFAPLFAAFPDFRCDQRVRHIIGAGGVVMAELVITGTHEGDFLGCAASHKPVSWNTTGVWEITPDGLISREAYYWDVDTLRRQLQDATA
ncbi:ester cyclase [Mycolicibacterium sp. CBM1]